MKLNYSYEVERGELLEFLQGITDIGFKVYGELKAVSDREKQEKGNQETIDRLLKTIERLETK